MYENFEYNFSIKFPSTYKVDYGIGKSSVVQAYDTTSGHIIAVSVSSSDFANISSDGYSDLQFAEKIVKDLFELYKTDEVRSKMTSGYEKRGFSDVTDNEPSLVNFNNIYFIKTNYKGYSIVNNEEYPVILIDFVTANKQYGYHFIFKSWSESYTASWQSKIIEIMSNVHISKNITNVNS